MSGQTPGRCPACRAPFRLAAVCPRCKADLEPLFRAFLRAGRLRREALEALAREDYGGAEAHALAALEYEGPEEGGALVRLIHAFRLLQPSTPHRPRPEGWSEEGP